MKTFKLDAEIGQKTQNVNFCGFTFRTIGPDSLEAFLKECAVGEKVKIEINSPGGSVIAGLAMANMVKNSKAHVIAHVVGIAASMASVVACACNEIEMEEAAFLMIHNPWSYADGDAEDLHHAAEVLEGMEVAMRAFYRGKFPSMTDAELDQLMAEETWMTGADCKARGMVCEVVPADVRAAACVTRRHFKHMPDAAAKFMEIHDAQPVADAPQPEAATEPQGDAAPPAEPTPAPGENWEARYKGVMRKMSEKADEITALHAQLDGMTNTANEAKAVIERLKGEIDAHKAQLADMTSKLDAAKGDLEKAKADLSAANDRADKAEKDLAAKGERLSTLEKAHALLTAGVLKPGGEANGEEPKGRTPEEREAIRKSRKNRKTN
jgi:ATP-dependent protease ClpP protease subunit